MRRDDDRAVAAALDIANGFDMILDAARELGFYEDHKGNLYQWGSLFESLRTSAELKVPQALTAEANRDVRETLRRVR